MRSQCLKLSALALSLFGAVGVQDVQAAEGDGQLVQRRYDNIGGGVAVSDLTSNPAYPNNPTSTTFINKAEIPADVADNYGTTIAGWIKAPFDADYTFYISADDGAELWLSSDSDPANLAKIAYEPQWNGQRQWKVTDRRNAAAPENKSATQELVGGQYYAVFALMKEGGGGDNLAFAAEFPGYTLNNGDPAIQGVIDLSAFGGSPSTTVLYPYLPGEPVITSQPQDATGIAGFTASFSVSWPGQGGLPAAAYQWYRVPPGGGDAVALPGATSRTYTTPVLSAGDTGAKYYVTINNVDGESSSSTQAELTVLTAPVFLSADSGGSPDTICVTFSEPVGDVANLDHYVVSGPGGSKNMLGASEIRPGVVLIKMAEAMTAGATYTVTVSDIRDSDNLLQVPNPSSKSFTHLAGYQEVRIRTRIYNDIGGTAVTDLTNNPKYPNSPNRTDYPADFFFGVNVYENYGGDIEGIYVAPSDGAYTFYCASDDGGALYVATDANPANKTRIATEPQWSNARNWVSNDNGSSPSGGGRGTPPSNQATLNLSAGQRVYMQFLFKEGGGGDHGGVHIQEPGAAVPANGAPAVPSSRFERQGYLHTASGTTFQNLGPVQIVSQFSSQSVNEGEMVTLSVSVDGSGPYSVDWTVGGQPLAGHGTTVSFVARPVNGNYTPQVTAVVNNYFSSLAATPATLTINSDTTAPRVVSAYGLKSLNKITVNFSEPMNASEIGGLDSYSIAGLNISGVTPAANGRSVTLDTDPQTPGQVYEVSIGGVHDLAYVPNLLNPNPTVVSITGFDLTCLDGQIVRERWNNLAGGNVMATLFNDPRWPASPDVVDYLNNTLGQAQIANNYGMRYSGHFIPSVTGPYVIEMHMDDSGLFYLSSNDSASGLVQELNLDGTCCGNYPTRSINLEAGRAYYFEALMQEGGGGDYLELRWKPPGAGSFVAIPQANLGYCYKLDVSGPSDQTVELYHTATFAASAIARGGASTAGAVQYTWEVSADDGATWSVIPGATSATLVIPAVDDTMDGYKYRFTANLRGAGGTSLTSATGGEATLTVIADTGAPCLASVTMGLDRQNITLTFSEPVVNGTDLNSYLVAANSGGATFPVLNAVYLATNIVRITVAPLPPNGTYTVTAMGPDESGIIEDPSENGMDPTCNHGEVSTGPCSTGIVGAFDGAAHSGVSLYGSAATADGVLTLTTAVNSLQGSIVWDATAGQTVYGFRATMMARAGGGTVPPADGWSFCFANDLPNASWGEEGAGSKLVISFDTYDNTDGDPNNGAGEAPAIDVRWAGADAASVKTLGVIADSFVPVEILVEPSGLVSVSYNNVLVHDRVATGWVPFFGGRFGIGGRTGGLNQFNQIKDLNISYLLPAISIARSGADLQVSWPALDCNVILQGADDVTGPWSNIDGATASPVSVTPGQQHKFYRLQMLP